MDPSAVHTVLTVLVGFVTGVLSAAFGIGGAIVSTPAIRLLGVSATFAVGTTLPSILPGAVAGTARYTRESLARWDLIARTAPVGAVAAVAGSVLSQFVPGEGHWLMVATALLLGLTAWRMGRGTSPPPAGVADDDGATGSGAGDDRTDHRSPAAVLAGIGAAAGMLSGLLGIGGGLVMVPAFTEVVKIPVKAATATSLVCVGLFALPATVAHSIAGDVDWRTAALLSVGVVPGARLGAAVAIRTSDRRLRRSVAAFLGLVAVVYAVTELRALA